MDELKVDKRTKEYRDAHRMEAIEDEDVVMTDVERERIKPPVGDFSKCPGCGVELPPNDDGSPKHRRFPEYCYDCVWANYDRKVGKKVEGVGSDDEVRKARDVLERYMKQNG